MVHSIKRNTVYGKQVTTNSLDDMLPAFEDWDCIRISGFTVFKGAETGIIHKGFNNIIIDSNIIIDCQVGIYAVVMGPVSTTHVVGKKTSLIKNNLIIGKSPSYKCSEDNAIRVSYDIKESIGAGIKYDAKIGIGLFDNIIDSFV